MTTDFNQQIIHYYSPISAKGIKFIKNIKNKYLKKFFENIK